MNLVQFSGEFSRRCFLQTPQRCPFHHEGNDEAPSAIRIRQIFDSDSPFKYSNQNHGT